MVEYHNRSVYLLEPIYLSLNCGEILISKTERGGFPVITEGLDVPSRASTQVVSSETQQPSKNSTLTSVSGQSNSLMSNMFEWEKNWSVKNVHICKNVPRLTCLCKDYVGFLFFDKFIHFGRSVPPRHQKYGGDIPLEV